MHRSFFDDADVDLAVEGRLRRVPQWRPDLRLFQSDSRKSGIYDAFAAKLASRVAKMKVGAGTDEGVVIGPMINGAAIEKIERHVADALEKGARIISERRGAGWPAVRPPRGAW